MSMSIKNQKQKKQMGAVVISQEKINTLHNIRITNALVGKPETLQSIVDRAINDFIKCQSKKKIVTGDDREND